jgi:chitin disaccharide deacetylase
MRDAAILSRLRTRLRPDPCPAISCLSWAGRETPGRIGSVPAAIRRRKPGVPALTSFSFPSTPQPKTTGKRRLIVTADDFGMAVPVNEAVEIGHRDGMLSAASLMVAGRAAEDAIDRARRLPRLGVGLHLVLVDGYPMLPPEQIPELVGPDGRFPSDAVAAGVRLFFSPAARRQAEAEIRAQFAAFHRTGLKLDHVNGHHHFHMHPTVQKILIRHAPAFGITAIRVPHEPFLVSWRAARQDVANRFLAWFLHLKRTQAMKRRLRRAGIAFNDHIFGLADSGRMRPDRLRAYLAQLPPGVSEIYVHPSARRWQGEDSYPEDYESEAEFRALTDAESLAWLNREGLVPEPFAALAGTVLRGTR